MPLLCVCAAAAAASAGMNRKLRVAHIMVPLNQQHLLHDIEQQLQGGGCWRGEGDGHMHLMSIFLMCMFVNRKTYLCATYFPTRALV